MVMATPRRATNLLVATPSKARKGSKKSPEVSAELSSLIIDLELQGWNQVAWMTEMVRWDDGLLQ